VVVIKRVRGEDKGEWDREIEEGEIRNIGLRVNRDRI
jgi:hypothetical protein